VRAVHLIRHAKAKNRLDWTASDELRPLTKRGRREAGALAERLGGEELTRLVSSPYVRCLQTLEPLALAVGLPIESTELLAEGADGGSAVELLLSVSGTGPVACCTHGDVLYDILGIVAVAGIHLDGPRDAPVASTWILAVEDGRFASARFVDQPPR
jgi:phosphohistidine phosphatase SixA